MNLIVLGKMDTQSEPENYRMYPSRWGVLLTVMMLVISSNLIWITFSPVSTKAAAYYDVEVGAIDLLSSVSFVIGIPFYFTSTFIVSKKGLR